MHESPKLMVDLSVGCLLKQLLSVWRSPTKTCVPKEALYEKPSEWHPIS